MIQPTFAQGVKRMVNSPKVHLALISLSGAYVAAHYAAPTLPPDQRAYLWIAFLGAVGIVVREIINSWSEADVADISNQKPAAPMMQVNTAEAQTVSGGNATQQATLPQTPATPQSVLSQQPYRPLVSPQRKP